MTQLAGVGLVVTPQMALVGLNPSGDSVDSNAPLAGAVTTGVSPTGPVPSNHGASVEAMANAALDAALGLAPVSAPAPTATGYSDSSAVLAESGTAQPADPLEASAAAATASAAVAEVVDDASKAGGAFVNTFTRSILVHNMFDKDEETELGWPDEIKEEFLEEAGQHGKILSVFVVSNEPGGKIYATFESSEVAKACAQSLAGRWFDKRQLRVEYVQPDDVPTSLSQ